MIDFFAILNPAAHGGQCALRARPYLDQLKAKGFQITRVETTHAGQAQDLVREAYERGHRRFLSIGGDGTTFEILNGIFPLGSRDAQPPTLAFLPVGTGNSFIRDFAKDIESYAFESLLKNRTRLCDVLKLSHAKGDEYFINQLGLGLVADVNSTRARKFSRLGNLGYVLGVFWELAGLHPYILPVRTQAGGFATPPLTFLSVANSRYTGGDMLMAPQADTADGQADVIAMSQSSRFHLILNFPKIFTGKHVNLNGVTCLKSKRIEFDFSNEVNVTLDGEPIRLLPRSIEVIPQALTVMV